MSLLGVLLRGLNTNKSLAMCRRLSCHHLPWTVPHSQLATRKFLRVPHFERIMSTPRLGRHDFGPVGGRDPAPRPQPPLLSRTLAHRLSKFVPGLKDGSAKHRHL